MSDTKEFLLEEYKSLTEAIRINEQTGETRLNFFYTVTSAVLGAIVFFLTNIIPESVTGEINNKPSYELDLVEMVILIFLMGLFFVGIIVQRRLRNRNRKTDDYIHDLERIREIFKQGNISTLPADYSTFKPRNGKRRKRIFTSLVDISRVMNIVILAIGITVGFFFVAETVKVSVTVATIVAGIAIFYGEAIWLSTTKEKPTHAGGVLFRRAPNGEVEFLVVKSSTDQQWVLPKGHIEHDETPQSAAIREVMEETGFLGRPKTPVGSISYTYNTKRITSLFFLMEISQPENRDKKWLSLESASSVLHPESGELLKKAGRLIEGT